MYSPGENPKKIIDVKNHFTFMKAKLTVNFTNFDGTPMELRLKGDYFERNATVTLDGVAVARIDREFLNARQLIGDAQTYYLTVAPNGTCWNVWWSSVSLTGWGSGYCDARCDLYLSRRDLRCLAIRELYANNSSDLLGLLEVEGSRLYISWTRPEPREVLNGPRYEPQQTGLTDAGIGTSAGTR